jgi:nucleoside-diphosphate-sugar epimerase
MARYLVTGAAGFIGSRVSELLLEDGHEVLGVDELNDAYDVRLKDHRRARLEAHAGFRFARLDIAEPGALEAAAGGLAFDALVNLAARAGVRASVERPELYVATNVAGSLETLELCRRRGIPKYLLASTSSLYGADNPRPFREDADTSRPLSPYAATKGGAEALAHSYHALHGIDVSVLRYFTVYGPAGRPDMSVFRFVQRIREGRPILVYGDGRQSRDFTYVDDIARGTVAALRPLGFEVVNLGGDEPHEVNELIRLVEERVGRKAEVRREPRHPADVPATWADIAKAEKLLGWRPAVAFAEGIARSVAWYEAERRWARDVETG